MKNIEDEKKDSYKHEVNRSKVLNLFILLFTLILLNVGCKNPEYKKSASSNTQEVEPSAPLIPPLPRLQMDIGKGSPDLQWWRDGKLTLDERIEWWRDARLGCFIHWNATSLLAGEWNDSIYKGYAEHIQRMAKIPCDVYRKEVVAAFNPTLFNADQWVKAIKKAGMRYLIITAKHHDGFAMYNSEVSDFNIIKATPFNRDPMVELKEACLKNGLKFGFYYSHAFDWGEPNSPGNDWDYENPGGDLNLFGGRNWYDKHPEIVPKYREYVDKKALPQILELINNYDPDIIWFDTPHKLPPEENLKILRAVRNAKPNILVNSRIIQWYNGMPGQFGDYQSTSDRAVDFPANSNDWETIPTTNESYGYSKHDFSHKTSAFLIRVIVKAAARGGNTLLNVGPRGDGTIDPIDLNILKGIGDWMDINETSIRGTSATTLPVQAWGESTRKGNTFFLHVFDWPEDGILELGGFRGKIKKAYLHSDSNKSKLEYNKLNKNTFHINIPVEAPNKESSSVIVVEVNDATNVDSQRLLSNKQNNMLRAFDGVAVGDQFIYGDGKSDRNYVTNWQNENQAMTWHFYTNNSARFNVIVEYKPSVKKGDFIVSINQENLKSTTLEKQDENFGFVKHNIGEITLNKGSYILDIRPVGEVDKNFMYLRAIHLIPVENK